MVPKSWDEVVAFAAAATFPVVVKNAEVWDRRNLVGSSVGASSSGTRVRGEPGELLALVGSGSEAPGLIMQEYIPAEHAEDWIVHLYSDANANCQVLFTGLKLRSWPPAAGVTACGISVANPALAALAERFCAEVGYSGAASLDWRLDRRDGEYKLLDFNPRVGNSFRLFQNEAGIDVVRALHLDLTGRSVRPGAQLDGRRLVVEHIDIPARITRRQRQDQATRTAKPTPHAKPALTEYAWLAPDDPMPLLAMLTHVISLVKIVRRGLRKPSPGAANPASQTAHLDATWLDVTHRGQATAAEIP